ncbi:C-C motif chemokine 4-like [Pristis pectinata]|uniref:C-C motif chemokine 4-like n=1 Tax=Pristis pectinata TaxID=685728 RepID=UPI00223D677B|nr:C-C motif chemokine 4-like [Pristis pectinata]
MKGHFALGLLLLEMACTQPTGAAVIPNVPFLPKERLTDQPEVELDCTPPSTLFKTKGGVEICVHPTESWMQKALDMLKKHFQQG